MPLEILLCLGIVALFFSALFRIVSLLRLGIPVLYILLMCTVFSGWYDTHESLADGILFALLACVALSWVYSTIHKIRTWI